MTTTTGLTDLNSANLNTLADNFRYLKGPGVALGTFLNQLAARANQAVASVAAAQTVTIATPAAADIVNINVNGEAFSHTLSAGDAVSATTAAVAMKTLLNADPVFAELYLATNVAGVLTITALQKGAAHNTDTLTTSVTGAGGTTSVAGGATFASGTGVSDVILLNDDD